jgi:hypothetical protein
MVWVTDGGVCPSKGGFSNSLAMQCINFCKKNNIIVVPYVEEAVKELQKMKNGNKGTSRWPMQLKHSYREMMGAELV